MLQTIREHTQGWIASIIIGLIILSFALWGIHSYFVGGSTNVTVAEVNGVEISKEQLASAYERLRRQVPQYGSSNTAALKSQALQSLIEMEVLKQASYQQGFRVYENEVDGYIQSIPEFQANGQFSMDRFQQVLASSMLSTNEFVELIKTSILIDQPKLGIMATSFALPFETKNTIALVNQERDIAYVNIPTESVLTTQTISITPQQIATYYNAHKKEFMTPEQVSISYVQLSYKDIPAMINPSDDQLRGFYTENESTFKTQPYSAVKDKVREMYVRQHVDEKYAELRDQLADLAYQHPDSLEPVAKAFNLSIQASEPFSLNKGGKDISENKKIRDVAFSGDVLTNNNNSDVIQLNPETMIVLRVKSHSKPHLVSLNEVSKQIEDKLRLEKADMLTAKAANDLMVKLQSGGDPAQLATSEKLTWTQPGFIGRNSTKVDSAVLDLAFRMPNPANKSTFGMTKLVNGYAVVELKSVKQGVTSDGKQTDIFAEQVQNSEGTLEYELYKKSQLAAAKIKVVK